MHSYRKIFILFTLSVPITHKTLPITQPYSLVWYITHQYPLKGSATHLHTHCSRVFLVRILTNVRFGGRFGRRRRRLLGKRRNGVQSKK